MPQLIESLNANPMFQTLPLEQREIYARLADEFEDSIDLALYLTPKELTHKLGIGNPQLWQGFLRLENVEQFIRTQVAETAKIASRKALDSLARTAASGDTTAAKQVNELAGIFNKTDQNKIVVLHQIKRPREGTMPSE